MDHIFIEQMRILDVCWADQNITTSVAVPMKSPDPYAVAWVLKRLQKWVLRETRVRTDPEASIAALAKAVVTASPFAMRLETTPVQSHQSIGHVERAHRILQEQPRANRLEIESHVNMKLNLTIPLGSWLVRHASWQLFRFAMHSEKRSTGYERVHGRSYEGAVVPFGEVVLARQLDDLTTGTHRYSKWKSR